MSLLIAGHPEHHCVWTSSSQSSSCPPSVLLLATTQPSSQRPPGNTLQVLWYVKHESDCLCVGVFTGHNSTQLSATAGEYTTSTVVREAREWLSLCGCVYWPQPSSQRPPGNTLQVLWYVKHESDCLCVGVFTGHNSTQLSVTTGEYTTSTVVREAREWLFLCGCVYWPQPSSQRPPGNTLQVLWYMKHESDCLCVGVFTGHNSTQLSATAGEYTTSTVVREAWEWLSLCGCVYWPQLNPALSDRRGIHYKYCGTWSTRVTVFVWVCLLATTQLSATAREYTTSTVVHEAWEWLSLCGCVYWPQLNPALSDRRGIHYKYCGTWSMRVTVFVWVCLLATTQLSATAGEHTTSAVVL